ncbi:serine/threonine-protein kinase, partial [Streptacidiphilus carbonis]|uniref:serine/threonine-protein kinase n=1 Tax=Streptacidiphilus carbonis TaxID=105422 RepID=UPI001EEF5663
MGERVLGGRYQLTRQLGEGGMGEVWEAHDTVLGRPVAVKVIGLLAGGGSRGDMARARFQREARITAALQHPNIVTVHDLGEAGAAEGHAPFLVMELLRGESLQAVVRRGPVPLHDAARWGAEICDALAEAHQAKVLHRDIKPSNIQITPAGTVKVLDFGIARAADPYATEQRLTQTGFIVGTPPYMAPEQARGAAEPRSDLYSLGCLLFEMITGRLPFQAPDTMGYLTAHLTQPPPAPSSIRATVPSAWDDLLLTLLSKDPSRRYPSAAELADALRQLEHGNPPASPRTGQPPGLVERTGTLHRSETQRKPQVSAAPQALAQQRRERAAAPPTLNKETPATQAEPTSEAVAEPGPFTVSWTGKEPLSSYTNIWQARCAFFGVTIVLALALTGVIIAAQHQVRQDGQNITSSGWSALMWLSIGFMALAFICLGVAAEAAFRLGKLPWSLQVGPPGIRTTRGRYKSEYLWDQVQAFAIHEV